MDPDFSNREITEMFNDIRKGQDRIEAQTVKTNGRTTALEKWRSFITGGLAVMVMLILPALTWALFQIVNLPNELHTQVQAAVQDALNNNK
jgi:cytochrome c-type biogenesis protein CcmH/NrfG